VMHAPLSDFDALTALALTPRAFLEQGVGMRLAMEPSITEASPELTALIERGELRGAIDKAEKKAQRAQKKRKSKPARDEKITVTVAPTKDTSHAALILKHLPKAPKFLRADKLKPRTGLTAKQTAATIQDLLARGVVVTKALGNHRGYATK
jgi:ribosomal protein S25